MKPHRTSGLAETRALTTPERGLAGAVRELRWGRSGDEVTKPQDIAHLGRPGPPHCWGIWSNNLRGYFAMESFEERIPLAQFGEPLPRPRLDCNGALDLSQLLTREGVE